MTRTIHRRQAQGRSDSSFESNRAAISCVAVVLLVASAPAFGQGASFEGLGFLPSASPYSQATGISDDGTVVVGESNGLAFRWDLVNGMQALGTLGPLPGGALTSTAFGVSGNGAVIVGVSSSPLGLQAFRWDAVNGMQGLGDLPGGNFFSVATSASADGSIFVGASAYKFSTRTDPGESQAFQWDPVNGMQGLGDLPGNYIAGFPRDVSGDGTVIVGVASYPSGTLTLSEAFLWDTATGLKLGLGFLPLGFASDAWAVSADGTVAVGYANGSGLLEAVRWDLASGLIEPLVPGGTGGTAFAISADGSTIVGRAFVADAPFDPSSAGSGAFIWDAVYGARNLKRVLQDDFGLDLSRWTLVRAAGVSADGKVIVGDGIRDGGFFEAWRAVLGSSDNRAPELTCPEPVVAECTQTGGADVALSAWVFDADGDALEVLWHIEYPDGSVAEVPQTATFGATPVPQEVTLTRFFPDGTSHVSLAVSDGTVVAECPAPISVMVRDTTAPIVAAIIDRIEVGTDPGKCSAVLDFDSADSPYRPIFSDICSPTITASHDAPEEFPVGTTIVTWTVSDDSGNTATFTQTVVVVDDEPPEVVPPPDLVIGHDGGSCVATGVSLGTLQATDNCGVVDVFNDAPPFFPLGDTEVTWYARDAAGNVGAAIQVVTVTNAAPIANAGPDRIVECTSPAGASVTLDGTATSDPDPGDVLTYYWSASDAQGNAIEFDDAASPTPTAAFPFGATTVTLMVTDQCGASDSADVIVAIEDHEAPAIEAIVTDPKLLEVPNHKIIPVGVRMLARDTCELPQLLNVTCVARSNEPDDTSGNGNFSGDVNGQDGYTNAVPVVMAFNSDTGYWEGVVWLRSERMGTGDGRKYSLICTAIDTFGNESTATACVLVPHDRRK